jgi:hypothetical protein
VFLKPTWLINLYTSTTLPPSDIAVILLEKSYPRCHNNGSSRTSCILLLSGDLRTITHTYVSSLQNAPVEGQRSVKQMRTAQCKEGNWNCTVITELSSCSKPSVSVSYSGSISEHWLHVWDIHCIDVGWKWCGYVARQLHELLQSVHCYLSYCSVSRFLCWQDNSLDAAVQSKCLLFSNVVQ